MRYSLRDRRQLSIVAALVFSSILCTLLLIVRMVYACNFVYTSMIWNLFLAWLPMISALVVYNLAHKNGRGVWLAIAGFAVLWLLFFPNAPYLLTDIANLRPRAGIPFWYDVLMFVAFAWAGTLLGLVSLYLMQALVYRIKGAAAAWIFALSVLVLSGFGVYLGRFPRYNSWDVFTSPILLLADIWDRISHPVANSQMFVFSAIFSMFLLSIYLILVAVMQFHRDSHPG